MTGFTSGKVSRDPFPYVWPDTPSRVTTGEVRSMFTRGDGIALTYRPRGEFDNHNPILSDFRENHDEDWDRNNPNFADVSIAGYLELCDTMIWGTEFEPALQRAWRDHARRVLTKLAALQEGENK